MDSDDGPYSIFVEILSYPRTRGRIAALAGEMISLHAEMNYLLGRTKGRFDRAEWVQHGDEYARYYEMFESAWVRYRELSDSQSDVDEDVWREVMDSFLGALNGARESMDSLKRDAASIGILSWI